ncbi:hypothetical protein HBI81_158770 [Parastagonospora nodorum]|nr:hypothetical protein HBI10_075620 [Parastagonospora nodorum]KAH4025915.1 hypothetical protein HBI13_071430 [Parastagonospora nodorum]KAH4062490.1 hypothetical protein HBH50_203940 [Parastagonospora nodorum]KAH4081045.1 hypothetical protein HBH48_199580 [Parastagonospora nodorum]KAH4106130.1 hypothetical protein HBH46_074160 [Parastagonospora nodorum]
MARKDGKGRTGWDGINGMNGIVGICIGNGWMEICIATWRGIWIWIKRWNMHITEFFTT